MAGECVEARPKRLRSNICRCCPRDPKHANQHPPVRRHTKSANDTGYNLCFSSTSCVNYEGQQGTRPRAARRAGNEAAGNAPSRERDRGQRTEQGTRPRAAQAASSGSKVAKTQQHLRLKHRWVPSERMGPTCVSREPIHRAYPPQKLGYFRRSNLRPNSRHKQRSRLLTSTHQGHTKSKAESAQTDRRSSIHTSVRKTLLRRKRRAHARRGNSR